MNDSPEKLAPKYQLLMRIERENQRRQHEFLKKELGLESLEGIVINDVIKHPFKKGSYATVVRLENQAYLLELVCQDSLYSRLFKRRRKYYPVSLDRPHYDA